MRRGPVQRAAVAIALGLGLGAAGCETAAMTGPARIEPLDEANLSALRAALGEALGRARVELGPENLAASSSVSVLPPPPGPLETHSLARPAVFDLVLEDGVCLAIARESGERVRLTGVGCVPAGG